MNTLKRYAPVAISGTIAVAVIALAIWLLYSDNGQPNDSGIQPTMPISLGTFLISLAAIVVITAAAAVIWVEIITPRRVERAHRNNLDGRHETIGQDGPAGQGHTS